MTMKKLTIATRGSKLALWQAHHTRDALIAAAEEELEVELLVLKTKGDRILDVPLAKVGGKGLFVKEIEEALISALILEGDWKAGIAAFQSKSVIQALSNEAELYYLRFDYEWHQNNPD